MESASKHSPPEPVRKPPERRTDRRHHAILRLV